MAILCASLAVVCFFDYGRGRIPNWMVGVIFAAGAATRWYRAGAGGLFRYIAVAAAVMAALYPIFRIGALGAGDVKLLGVCSGYFPFSQVFSFLFFSMLIAAIFSIFQLIRERNAKERAQYFCEYCGDVLRSGKWQLYLPEKSGKRYRGICLSGPVLCSMLLCWGGVL